MVQLHILLHISWWTPTYKWNQCVIECAFIPLNGKHLQSLSKVVLIYNPSCRIWKFLLSRILQFSSVAQSCLTLRDPMNCSTPGLPVHHQLPEFTQTQRPSSQWCHPAISSSVVPFSSCPQSLQTSGSFPMSQLFAWGGQSTGVPALASIIPSKEIPGLISFRMDWLDLLAVQGTLKSLLQHHRILNIFLAYHN